MKAVISSTYDDQYLFFLPIVAWCWNKLGVDVICFLPELRGGLKNAAKLELALTSIPVSKIEHHLFKCPKHKEATYAQCSRLYAAALDLPEYEVLITSDVDMAVFSNPMRVKSEDDFFDILGQDLVPPGQLPICYIMGTKKTWNRFFSKGRSLQNCLDDELAHEECLNFRGNFWSRDQELAFKNVGELFFSHLRARPGTQFASHRVDRDDINWRSYVNDDLLDAHLWRPGYTDENFANIMELLQMKYPQENFQWLIEYRENYLKLLNS